MSCEICFLDSDFVCPKCNFSTCDVCFKMSKPKNLCVGLDSNNKKCDLKVSDLLELSEVTSEVISEATSESKNKSIIFRIKLIARKHFKEFDSNANTKKIHEINKEFLFDDLEHLLDFERYLKEVLEFHDLNVLNKILEETQTAIETNKRKIKFYDDIIFRINYNRVKSEIKTVIPRMEYSRNTKNGIITEAKKEIKNKCMRVNCDGDLYSDKFICVKCDQKTCNECLVSFKFDHICDKNHGKELYKGDTQNCPKCNTLITKLPSCSTVSCVNCGLVFNWNNTSENLGYSETGDPHKFKEYKTLGITQEECNFLKNREIINKVISLRKTKDVSPFHIPSDSIRDYIQDLCDTVSQCTNSKISSEHEMYLWNIIALNHASNSTNLKISKNKYKIFDLFVPELKKWNQNFNEDEKLTFLLCNGAANEILIPNHKIIEFVEFSSNVDDLLEFYLMTIGRRCIYNTIIKYTNNISKINKTKTLAKINRLINLFEIKDLIVEDLTFEGFTCANETRGFILLQ